MGSLVASAATPLAAAALLSLVRDQLSTAAPLLVVLVLVVVAAPSTGVRACVLVTRPVVRAGRLRSDDFGAGAGMRSAGYGASGRATGRSRCLSRADDRVFFRVRSRLAAVQPALTQSAGRMSMSLA